MIKLVYASAHIDGAGDRRAARSSRAETVEYPQSTAIPQV